MPIFSFKQHQLTHTQTNTQKLKNTKNSTKIIKTTFYTFILSQITNKITNILNKPTKQISNQKLLNTNTINLHIHKPTHKN
ncbi:terminase small subunit [Klebsiella pneumoniae]|uniref:terminase small subunit n=1 Tax=Klebsiella pneumoniae TaxID=573 RepID=UPI003B5C8B57